MEQNSTSIWKSSVTSGLYLGIALILVSVVFYVTGNMFVKWSQYLGYAIMIAGVVMAQISYRKSLGGTMTYGQALGMGVLTVLFASILTGIYTYLLYTVIDPSLPEQMRIFTEEQLIKQGRVPEDQMQAALDMQAKFQKPVFLLIMSIIGGTLIGLIISLITSIFTKKVPKDIIE